MTTPMDLTRTEETPNDNKMPEDELKQFLYQCVTGYESLSDKDKVEWKKKEAQDLERANREEEESDFY